MPEKITISHRGARYEIGRGKRYYGIWATGALESDPVDRWPETPDGWVQAWTRFVTLEAPETITPAERGGRFRLPRVRLPRPRLEGGTARTTAMAAAGLLGLGVAAGIAGLFPNYYFGASLVSQAGQLVPHLLYLIGWAVSAALVADGIRRGQADSGDSGGGDSAGGAGGRIRAGALLGTGLSVVALGFFLSDLAQAVSGSSAVGAGLVLSLVGWAACAAGSVAGLAVPSGGPDGPGRPVRPRPEHAGPVALLVLGALGAAAAFAPSWDSFTLWSPVWAETITRGNAFSNPGAVIAADLLVMAAIVAVALAAALWHPARQGAALLAGALVPMVADAISALIQVSQPQPPSVFTYFGQDPSRAAAEGLSITAGLTPVFWVYCVFVVALAISCAWLLTEPAFPAAPSPVPSPWAGPVPGGTVSPGGTVHPGGTVSPGDTTPPRGDGPEGGTEGGPEGGGPEDDTENSYA